MGLDLCLASVIDPLGRAWEVAEHVDDPAEVVIATETDRGLFVGSLVAAGYAVYASQSDVGGPLPGTSCHLWSRVRSRRRGHVGGVGPHRPPPPPKASGKSRVVLARYARNLWAFAALNASPGARSFYETPAERLVTPTTGPYGPLANWLVGLLHGCPRHQALYDEHTAWDHRQTQAA